MTTGWNRFNDPLARKEGTVLDRRKGGELRTKIKWLMLARLVVVTLLLGLSFLLRPDHLRNSGLVISSTYLLIAIYASLIPHRKNLFVFISTQLVLDLLLETFLVGVTGGIQSPFTFLYLISIVSWSIFFQKRGAIVSTTLSSLLYGTVINLQYSRYFDFLQPVSLETGEFLYAFLINLFGFFAVGVLSGLLAENLRQKEVGFAALQVFHEDIVESISSGLVTTDLEGRVSSYNRAATEISGYPLLEAKGRVWWELFAWSKIEEHYRLLFSERLPQRFDGETKNRWGERLILGVTLSPLKDHSGRSIGVIGVFQDLTKYKRLEEEMARREKLATIGEMAAAIAHEIRNPLAALSGSIQALREEVGQLSYENGRLLEIACDEAERLNAIITQFLVYARPRPLNQRWCDLSILLQDTLCLAKNNAEYHETVKINIGFPDQIFQWVDPDQMKQVFWNLIINAFQSMPDGGDLSVSMRKILRPQKRNDDRKGDAIEITFSDSGEGIPEKYLEKIFSPFFSTKGQGSGLGLAIVQRIVDGHGGRVCVDSSKRGTVFTIYVPSCKEMVSSKTSTEDFERTI